MATACFDARVRDVGVIQEVCRDRFGVNVSESVARSWVQKLPSRGTDFGCLAPGNSGVVCWLMNRIRESGLCPARCCGAQSIRLTVELHFWRWNLGLSSPFKKDESYLHTPAVYRSPLSRLGDAEPINRVARRIAGDTSRPCLFCKQYFRNPDALVLHLVESHGAEVQKRGRLA